METRSKKRKRQRLLSISSNVSSWPDLPARFESLNDDTLTNILQFVGNKSYRTFGGLNYHSKEIYITSGMTKETYFYGYAPLSRITDKIEGAGYDPKVEKAVAKGVVFYNRHDVMDWALQEKKQCLLRNICAIAAAEERIDILDEVLNNVEDDEYCKRYIFKKNLKIEDVNLSAARHGRLNVLKWLHTKSLFFHKYECGMRAARQGHLNILEWLQEEKGLELKIELYHYAAYGGHLHVIKWLREKEVDWYEYTFASVAENGNLDVLQWLHDEGCPWDPSILIDEEDLKPEILDWCRSNGYGDRVDGD